MQILISKKKKKKSEVIKAKLCSDIFELNFSFSKTVILLKYLFEHICFMSTHRMGSEGGVTILRKRMYEVAFFFLLLHK